MSESVLPIFSSRTYMVPSFTFRSLIHFEFIFVYGVREFLISFFYCPVFQRNLQSQCNPYQVTNSIFHRIRTKVLKICMETQKTAMCFGCLIPNSQRNLEKEKWSQRSQDPWLQTILHSYSHQDSMVLAKRQKYRSMEQNRKPRDKSTHMDTLALTKEARIYNGVKTISLTSGAGKTGQPLVKEWN